MGNAIGLAIVESFNELPGDHEYPETPLPFNWMESPRQMARSKPALTGTVTFTITFIESGPADTQPFVSVTITKYSVFTDGEAQGLKIVVSDKVKLESQT